MTLFDIKDIIYDDWHIYIYKYIYIICLIIFLFIITIFFIKKTKKLNKKIKINTTYKEEFNYDLEKLEKIMFNNEKEFYVYTFFLIKKKMKIKYNIDFSSYTAFMLLNFLKTKKINSEYYNYISKILMDYNSIIFDNKSNDLYINKINLINIRHIIDKL